MNAIAAPDISIASFENGTIDAEAFDHQAHIFVAWLYLERYPLLEAVGRFSAALRRLTRQLGIPGKYHETITWFFLFLIAARREASAPGDWHAFRRDNADLFAHGEDSILRRYYSRDVLAGADARRSFVLPNRLAA